MIGDSPVDSLECVWYTKKWRTWHDNFSCI